MRTRKLMALVAAALLAVTVAACGSDDDNAQATADSIKKRIEEATKDTSGGGVFGGGKQECPKLKPAVGKMRVVHLAAADGKALGPVDVYADGYGPDQNCDPLVKGLEYGQVSDYLDVPASPYSDPPEGGLQYYDAGVKERTGFWKGNAPNDGVETKGDQETVVLSGGVSEGEAAPTWSNITERSTKQPELDVKVASGKAVLYVSEVAATNALSEAGDQSVLSFTIDGKCTKADPPENDFDVPGGFGDVPGNAASFTVEPGTHTVGIVVTPPGVGIGNEDCDGNTPVVTESVDAGEGTASSVYLGGTSATDLKILVGEVDLG